MKGYDLVDKIGLAKQYWVCSGEPATPLFDNRRPIVRGWFTWLVLLWQRLHFSYDSETNPMANTSNLFSVHKKGEKCAYECAAQPMRSGCWLGHGQTSI